MHLFGPLLSYPTTIKDMKLTTHQWFQNTPYVCSERIFEDLQSPLNIIFLQNSLERFVILIFSLLLVPIESKLVNNQSHSKSSKIRDNSTFVPFSHQKRRNNDLLEVFKDWEKGEWLSNLYSKGAKISVNVRATNVRATNLRFLLKM